MVRRSICGVQDTMVARVMFSPFFLLFFSSSLDALRVSHIWLQVVPTCIDDLTYNQSPWQTSVFISSSTYSNKECNCGERPEDFDPIAKQSINHVSSSPSSTGH